MFPVLQPSRAVHTLRAMKILLSGLAATALLAPQAQALSTPPPPPIIDDQPVGAPLQWLKWTPGEVRCGGQAVAPVAMGQPAGRFGFVPEGAPTQQRYRFRIDAAGRPLTIVQDSMMTFSQVAGDDPGAVLAVSRFPAGPARSDCTIAFVAQGTPIDAAPPGDLMAYSISSMFGRMSAPAWKRITPAGSTCFDTPRPAPLIRVLPDFDALPATPGVKDWSMVGYDLDAKGRPTQVRIVEGTGNRALDAASVKAIQGSRFTGGARTACLYPFWRKPAPVASPESPDKASLRPEGSNCPADRPWAVMPKLIYPAAYRQRGIEGWAAIAYDVAPWGETGNIRVLASEPATAFGQQAIQIVRLARKAPSQESATGCVEIVRFVIGKDDAAADDETPGVARY